MTLLFLIWASGCSGSEQERIIIETVDAPAAIGPYSQGILTGNTLYAAGQIGLIPGEGRMAGEDLESQTRQALDNLGAVLEESGMDYQNVVSVDVFLSDIDNFSAFNAIYSEYFTENPPARAVVEAARLPRDALVEIKLIAVKN
ncbi:MAG: RidA family protein [Balneolaceae bacterium]|nr:RidA family protein [Balneolaceae bacterium]